MPVLMGQPTSFNGSLNVCFQRIADFGGEHSEGTARSAKRTSSEYRGGQARLLATIVGNSSMITAPPPSASTMRT